jgi:hypothetical protein
MAVEFSSHPDVQEAFGAFDVVLQVVAKDHPLGDDIVTSFLGLYQSRRNHYIRSARNKATCARQFN